ncbi:EAL domain-containing protein [Frateuria terrea]|uniref:EAL domain, c-di-GMP-specific phosphodiesterase class I (Or its enzymatically inactive variant) n=1 Tax=Frateuria terrea TaxID=529704 RepID=A0A1H6V941_9GAMM|nr:EAL domain-containing protein [Frateuria terrea]SEJ00346.1 EAL domain, c-di-GMP-specific phosphodiesterase class I (or its enzymatically inactive variant) [Frateuria terrea]SFP65672.1 EAL domain, c-di-GMP-specific phosphodiesterase class I (or its enzymatically inactive variant) [Frateuria terrea]
MEPTSSCGACRDGEALGFDFSMALQPIVEPRQRRVFAYEALVRGLDGSGAAGVLEQLDANNLYRFDQACRVKAVSLAARLGVDCRLSINFLPNAVYQAATCLRATLATANRVGFPTERLMFEFVEHEQARDRSHLASIVSEYRRHGFLTALDDFGAGYSGLALLADIRPDWIKLDMALIRGIDQDPVRRCIVRHNLAMCEELGVAVIAEGIETMGEWQALQALGVTLFQGYLFARPGFECLPEVHWPEDEGPGAG